MLQARAMRGEAKLMDRTSKPSSAFSPTMIATVPHCAGDIGAMSRVVRGSVDILTGASIGTGGETSGPIAVKGLYHARARKEIMTGVAVCVPVRDEAVLLPGFLEAMCGQDAAFTLCLLFDGCADGSAEIVAERAAGLPFPVRSATLLRREPNAGRARRAAMALGEAVLAGAGGLLLTTDADSRPEPGWVAANGRALARADVVAGRIRRAPADRAGPSALQDRLEEYYDRLFALRRRIDPVPWEAERTHHYASGASLGFRADAYRALGGFESLAAGEDGRIVDAAHRAGLRVRRDAEVVVETSARRVGRATGGLADHLRALDRGAGVPTMAHPADAAWRWRAQAAARAAFGGDLRAFAALIGSALAAVTGVAHDAPNAEAFATGVVPEVPGGERLVGLDVAAAALAALEGERVQVAA